MCETIAIDFMTELVTWDINTSIDTIDSDNAVIRSGLTLIELLKNMCCYNCKCKAYVNY